MPTNKDYKLFKESREKISVGTLVNFRKVKDKTRNSNPTENFDINNRLAEQTHIFKSLTFLHPKKERKKDKHDLKLEQYIEFNENSKT